MSSKLDSHIQLPEPELSFHPDRDSDRDIHPLRGLLEFGPYSKGLVPDPIRIATLSPQGNSQKLYDFISELKSKATPSERREYLPEWPSFHRVFGLHMLGAGRGCHIELDRAVEEEIQTSERPHLVFADRLVRSIQGLEVADWLLGEEELAEFLRPVRNALQADSYTNRESGRALNIDESAIPAAINMGLLEEVRRDNKKRVSGTSLRAFQSKYRPIKELADKLQTSSARLTRLGRIAGIEIMRLERTGGGSKLSLILRTDESRLTDKFKKEQADRDMRAPRAPEKPRASRLQAYFNGLEADDERLPRRAGKPAKAVIERKCGFCRGTIDRRDDLSRMLEEQDQKEKKGNKALGPRRPGQTPPSLAGSNSPTIAAG